MNNRATKKWFTAMLAIILVFTWFGQAERAEAALDLEAETAILVDANTGKILYQKDIDKVLPIASMTKMMSEYLILEALDNGDISEDQVVPISDHIRQLSLHTALSNVPLRQDYEYTVQQLYESVAIYSANASTMALAELIAGSERAFVDMMNAKGEELGLEDFEFVNSSGLNNSDLNGNHPDGTGADAENMMSARATAQLAYALIRDYPEVLDTASIPTKEFDAGPDESITMQNWNWMLPGIVPEHDYEGIDGLKTGYTSAAGNSFTGTAKRGDMRLISVVMRTETRDDRFNETAKIMDYGFNQFEHVEIAPEGYVPDGEEIVPVVSGKEKEVTISSTESLTTIIQSGDEDMYEAALQLDGDLLNENNELVAPFDAGVQVGQLMVSYTGEGEEEYLYPNQQTSVPVAVDTGIEKAGWFTMTMRSIGGFFSGIWGSAVDTVQGWFS